MTGAAYLRALAAQARGVLGDRTLVGVCTGALLLSMALILAGVAMLMATRRQRPADITPLRDRQASTE